ncbi:hypothetical protein K1T71_006800 [Dendrolimus kikuchii]|uniref:Uncharacterized protein n=1 Tax=Dendrolimus kikuchii TaxID=765133 RepID=A0ACC1D310_9NEOP|nr:hypothetical protein K1T71_006800 [Dendrolimus kikuchii]
MFVRLLSLITTIMAVGTIEGQLHWSYEDDLIKRDGNLTLTDDFEPHCNYAVCSDPCEGAAPPPVCPSKQVFCPSGCACYSECGTATIICYMTKHCQEIKRLFTRKKKYETSAYGSI